MPSQRMKIGTQAIEGMARSAWMEGSSRRRAGPLAGHHAEHSAGVGADAEADRDAGHGRRDMQPELAERASARMVSKILLGGGTSRPFDQPRQTMNSPDQREPDRQQQAEHRPRSDDQRDRVRGASVAGTA